MSAGVAVCQHSPTCFDPWCEDMVDYIRRVIIDANKTIDPCIQAADNNLTEKMFQRFVSAQFQNIVFLREKGPKYALPTVAGNYDLYAGQHRSDLLSANASTVL
eukprot:COSAG03_NODE_17146_length_383_cov_0.721831_1_plen_103_part_10